MYTVIHDSPWGKETSSLCDNLEGAKAKLTILAIRALHYNGITNRTFATKEGEYIYRDCFTIDPIKIVTTNTSFTLSYTGYVERIYIKESEVVDD